MRIDSDAVTAREGEPAFVARPAGAPVYHGFPILEDIAVEGFRLGMITDWEAEACEHGDAFVVAPDGSRAGLVWEVSTEPWFSEVIAFEAARWGVWAVSFPLPMSSRDNARRNLEHTLPVLRAKWTAWREQQPA